MFHSRRIQTDVLVAGAGPIGLCAALSLTRAGAQATVVDTRWHAARRHGCVILHPQSLGLLGDLGVVHPLLGAGAQINRIEVLDEAGSTHTRLDLSRLDEPYPFALALPHQVLVEGFAEALASRGVEVQWHHRLTSLEEGDDGVLAHVDELDHESTGYAVSHIEEVVERSLVYQARALVGATGENTVIRRFLGGDSERVGSRGVMVVFELESSGMATDTARLVLGPHGTSTLIPLPHDKVQWSFFLDGKTYPEDRLTPEGLRELLGARARWAVSSFGEEDIAWAGAIPYDGLSRTQRGRGSVWLVGEAAHPSVPTISHPLNSGLAEAHAIGARLAAAVEGRVSSADVSRTSAEFALETRALLETKGQYAADEGVDAWIGENAAVLAQCIPARLGERDALFAQMGLRAAEQRP